MQFNFDEFEDLIVSQTTISDSEIIFTPSLLVNTINQNFNYNYPLITISGEVANFKINQNKFVFFDIKDSNSTVNCFMMLFAMKMPIQDGMQIIAKVEPKITDWGKFNLTVKEIKPVGEGNIKKSLDIIKDKLAKEGIFDQSRKRLIPRSSNNIAVISSTEAAGYADFIKIINERWGGIKIRVAHTQVQGESASKQIINAVNYFNQVQDLPDLIVIIRGGGSANDLMAFNDELLARTIAGSRVPVITGIGHEIDCTLSDLAADFAGSTPSNVAQIITRDRQDEIIYLNNYINNFSKKIVHILDEKKNEINITINNIHSYIMHNIDNELHNLNSKIRLLDNLNPQKVLSQGYALVRGRVEINSIIDIETNSNIIKAEVKDVTTK
ncbi:exodeoxyribonuclease VII large subunit [Candidatus Nanogingivalis gingivitcus]|jgi:exodeoxyribonuclease VII, large subunit|uniref:Exodeoxyribonuclease VII large subunit n=1 Tax=Candidatus Nanogingivalis gingivitcus TaxID=2171992 RepID=A0ABY0FHJ7_9BACT|nr:exodeoxyribonuclease VII large subunit [Candidatus Nanogingivalis gingivitcus]RYC72437.1 Exodeoxyribonuclease 7 large subunit [Candidatus Nanogingivalis gingivitcus]